MKQAVLIAVCSIVVSGCRPPLLEENAAGVCETSVGKTFRINLAEDHSKGETWRLDGDYDRNILLFNGSVWHGPTKGIDFNFKALAAGESTLNFSLRTYADTLSHRAVIVKITHQ